MLGVVEESEEESDEPEDAEDGAEDPDSDADSSGEADGMEVDFTLDLQKSSGRSTSTPAKPGDGLRLDSGFEWFAPNADEDVEMDSDGSDSDEQKDSKKKRKRKEIEQDLTADMHSRAPESNSDFERLLLGSPNSSYLWVQYMSFQLQISEIDKAREIAKRALKTINFREEQEKLNVWIALLNLENVYGTDESLEAAFKDAARHNESKTIHLRLADILEQSDKLEASSPSLTPRLICLQTDTESGGTVQANMQEVLSEFQGLDIIRRTLPQAWHVRGRSQAAPSKPAEFRKAQTYVFCPCASAT